MYQVQVIDFISTLPVADPRDMMNDRASMQRGFFALACISEKFEEMVGERFKTLAEALVTTSSKLYELVHESTDDANGETMVNPQELRRAFQRFENVLLCVNELYFDIICDDLRTQPLWANLQEYYRVIRYVFVKNPNLLVT